MLYRSRSSIRQTPNDATNGGVGALTPQVIGVELDLIEANDATNGGVGALTEDEVFDRHRGLPELGLGNSPGYFCVFTG
jgi:hypothetical protein